MNFFSEIEGNEQIVRSLKNSIISKKVSHAYIFSGEAGMGKALLAKSFAKALQCEAGGTDACGKCLSCQTFESGNHPDIFYVKPEGKSLGVDAVRDKIVKTMETKPYRYPYKIFVIYEAETMTVQAQNALLKTIEEPAGYGIFLLLAKGTGLFLPTVLSRCVVNKLKPLGEKQVRDFLLKRNVAEDAAMLAGVYARGNIGKALELAADQEFIEMRRQVLSIIERADDCNLVQLFALAKEFDAFKDNIQEVLDVMYLWYRDLAALKSTGNPEFLVQRDSQTSLYRQAGGCSMTEVLKKLDAVWQAKRQIKQHGNFQLVIEIMLLEMCL